MQALSTGRVVAKSTSGVAEIGYLECTQLNWNVLIPGNLNTRYTFEKYATPKYVKRVGDKP